METSTNNFLYVGIGPKNFENSLGTYQYDSKSTVYDPDLKDQSTKYNVPIVVDNSVANAKTAQLIH